jgi:hypothetical protein
MRVHFNIADPSAWVDVPAGTVLTVPFDGNAVAVPRMNARLATKDEPNADLVLDLRLPSNNALEWMTGDRDYWQQKYRDKVYAELYRAIAESPTPRRRWWQR